MGVYTKTGDKGTTGLLTGERVAKDSLRVEAYGAVDEMNAALGLARSLVKKETVADAIYKLQKLNMLIMAELACANGEHYIKSDNITDIECAIDKIESQLPPLTAFIIPGDTQGGAALDMARAVIRRAERRVLELSREASVCEDLLILLNRLSDYCFVLMRFEEA